MMTLVDTKIGRASARARLYRIDYRILAVSYSTRSLIIYQAKRNPHAFSVIESQTTRVQSSQHSSNSSYKERGRSRGNGNVTIYNSLYILYKIFSWLKNQRRRKIKSLTSPKMTIRSNEHSKIHHVQDEVVGGEKNMRHIERRAVRGRERMRRKG